MTIADIIAELKKQLGMYRNANMLTNPQRDWAVLLAVMLVLAPVIFVGSALIFYAVGTGSFAATSSSDAPPVKTIDRTELKRTIEAFNAKEAEHERLLASPPSVIDPS